MESMAALVGSGGPVSLLAYTSMAFYIKLMKGITARPVVEGQDIQREKVRFIALLLCIINMSFFYIDKAQEDQLDDGGGDHDPHHHRDGVRDLIHLNLHFPIPLAPHDPTHETQHQPPGSDLHWIGGDS